MMETPGTVSGSVRSARRALLALAGISVVWSLAIGGYGLWSWPAAHAALQQAFDEGARGCRQRYADKSRQDRCIDLFRILYVGDRNAGVFTRVVFTLLPPALGFAGLFAWSFVQRRAAEARRGRRARPPS